MYKQLKIPDLSVETNAGWCLWESQEIYHVQHIYRSAWEVWLSAQLKHYDRDMPNVSVPCYFEHWGTYGTPPTYDNWGHIVAYVPGVGFVSSPDIGYGQDIYSSLEEIERIFNCKFVGWSEDLSGELIIVKEEEQEVIEIQPPVFNKDYYIANNQDIIKSDIDPVSHWIQYGIAEGRKSCPNFHVQEYLENYPDLQAVYDKDFHAVLLHYYNNGINEFRFGTKEAKEKYESLSKPITPADCPQSATDIEKDTNNKVNKIWSFLTSIFSKKD